jgi:RHS repeat-associated protein
MVTGRWFGGGTSTGGGNERADAAHLPSMAMIGFGVVAGVCQGRIEEDAVQCLIQEGYKAIAIYPWSAASANLGQYYLRERYYDTTKGRFTAEDNYSGSYWTPSTFNKYVYAASDPVNLNDPSGFDWQYDNSENGLTAHFAFSIFALIQGKTPTFDFPLASVAAAVGDHTFDNNPIGGELKPDAVDFSLRRYYELKPITHRGQPGGLTQADKDQLDSYARELGQQHGFTGGMDLVSTPLPIALVPDIDGELSVMVLWPSAVPGLIYYSMRNHRRT